MTLSDDIKAVRDWQNKWKDTVEKHQSCFAHPYKNELARILSACEEMEKALEFYGFEAIYNPESEDKALQYWKDRGIDDHGQRARECLKRVRGESK